jgi:hypothetical protein
MKTLDVRNKTNTGFWKAEKSSQIFQGPGTQGAALVSSMDFLLDSYMPDLELKKPATPKHSQEQGKKFCYS